ncbi:MAG TPA: hypothetical protein VHL11_11485 [Phototrophicaceae bacterium]|jgi:hypothetical protein|nr:hypothetical protein [Phototrophicaceae bacterium]
MKRLNKITAIVFALVITVMAVAAVPAMASPISLDEDKAVVPIAADAVFYHTEDGIEIWTPDADGNWNLTLRLSNDEIDAVDDAPAVTQLVAESGKIAIYKSPNGEWSVANGPDAEGKIRVVVFDSGFGYDHEYENNVYSAAS